jgi:hypothetical protein
MARIPAAAAFFLVVITACPPVQFLSLAQSPATVPRYYLGFDRNVYPGDAAISELRRTFSFTGYWLSPPPGEAENTWLGKRALLRSKGFGFLVLYRGRGSRELGSDQLAAKKGNSDASSAVAAARQEGFPPGTIIFLDIEEGGRLPAYYHLYLRAWTGGLARAGYRPGVYCSAIPVKEEPGASITTSDDIRNHDGAGTIAFWVYNDVCPPSPGCAPSGNPPPPSSSGIRFAAVWQFAQSPGRSQFTSRCPGNYHPDGNCYAPADIARKWFLDLNTALSPDPSNDARPAPAIKARAAMKPPA